MNALTKFALVITSIVLPLSANAAIKSNLQDSTTLAKSDIVKLVDIEMKLSATELLESVKIEKQIVTVPMSRLFVFSNTSYSTKSAPRIVVNKP